MPRQAAFESAKALLCNLAVQATTNFTLPFKLKVDASLSSAGTKSSHLLLFQVNKHKLNNSTTKKEAFALMIALQKSEVYIVVIPSSAVF